MAAIMLGKEICIARKTQCERKRDLINQFLQEVEWRAANYLDLSLCLFTHNNNDKILIENYAEKSCHRNCGAAKETIRNLNAIEIAVHSFE